jgi:hypothetical protein
MRARDIDEATTAQQRADLYFIAHPGSPAAVRRPKISVRSGVWIALLGRNVQEGVVGLGSSVEAALRAFDVQYLASLRLPSQPAKSRRPLRPSKLRAA